MFTKYNTVVNLKSVYIMPSTVIASFYYSAEKRRLTICFTSGIVYVYKNVPEKIYLDMKTSFSKGIFFNQYIKGNYEFEKVN